MNNELIEPYRPILSLAKPSFPLSGYDTIQDLSNSGIYSIWWTSSDIHIESLHRQVKLQGKVRNKKEKETNPDDDNRFQIHEHKWECDLTDQKICLYVGKSSNIKNRIAQHLLISLESDNWYTPYSIRKSNKIPDLKSDFLVKRTSSCQVRAGIEHLFKKSPPSTIEDKLKHFKLSYILEERFSERFFLENLAIGYYRPWFNLDSER